MANKERLIDAEAVQHKIKAFAASVVYRGNAEMFTGKDSCNPHEYTRGYERGILDAQKLVSEQSTVDAVEVVRCKVCKHRGSNLCPMETVELYPWFGTRNDAYCSYGERKVNG